VFRNTIGWHEDSVDLTTSELARATKMSRPSVVEGARLAIGRGTIKRVVKGRSFTYEPNIVSVKNLNRSKTAESKEDLPISVNNLDQSADLSLDVLKKGKKHSASQPKPERLTTEIKGLGLPYADPAYSETWIDFEIARKELRAPLGPKQKTELVEQLATVDMATGIRIMKDTIRKGYRNFDWYFDQNGKGNGANGKRQSNFESASQRDARLIREGIAARAVSRQAALNHHPRPIGAIPSTTGTGRAAGDD
jgi:hypothetical protein